MTIKILCQWLCRPLQKQLDALEQRVKILDGELSAAKRLCEALSSDLSNAISELRVKPGEAEPRVRVARRFSQFSEAATIASLRKQGE